MFISLLSIWIAFYFLVDKHSFDISTVFMNKGFFDQTNIIFITTCTSDWIYASFMSIF